MAVVVDASVALKWVFQEEQTAEALALWDHWQERGERVMAPPLFRAEVTNVIHQQVRRGALSRGEAVEALETLISLVAAVEPSGLYARALELASRFGQGATYDAHYVALAVELGCALWTADERLVRAVQSSIPAVRGLSEAPHPSPRAEGR